MGLSLIREAGAHNLSCLADLSPSEFASGYEGAGVLPENMQVQTLNPHGFPSQTMENPD
jgi:hypothetical protein